MILAITEQNAWENESWTYVLDVEKQDASSLNFMMIFVRLANIQFEVDRENAKKNGQIMMVDEKNLYNKKCFGGHVHDGPKWGREK